MADVKGCELPDDLWYDVENMLWYRPEADGLVRVGPTRIAVAMGGEVVGATPKRADRRLEPGQACAVVEAGKYVGPAKIAFGCHVVESHEALMDDPSPVNRDPYGEGWFVLVRPDDWAAASAALLHGPAAIEPFLAKMAAEEFEGCETAAVPSAQQET